MAVIDVHDRVRPGQRRVEAQAKTRRAEKEDGVMRRMCEHLRVSPDFLKDVPVDRLMEAARAVQSGRGEIQQSFVAAAVARFSREAADAADAPDTPNTR